MDWFWIAILVLSLVLAEILAIAYIYEYSRSRVLTYFILGILFYAGVGWFMSRSFRLGSVSLIFSLASSLTLIMILLVGRFYYLERWTTKEWVAIFLIIGAIFLLYLNSRDKKKINHWVG